MSTRDSVIPFAPRSNATTAGAFHWGGPTDQNESAIAATTAALAANIRMATASGRIIVGMIGCSLLSPGES
jgi:hypothetical protein